MQNGTAIAYNGNSLQTGSILVNDIDLEAPPSMDAKIYDMAHSNTVNVPYTGYPSKTIPVSGTIQAPTIQALDSLLDTFRSWFVVQNGNLDVAYSGSTRRFLAVQAKITSLKRPGGLTYAKFTVTFTTKPFGQDTATTTAVNATGRTGSSYTDSFTFTGNAPYQKPIINLTYTAVTSTGSQTVSIGNNANGQQISITRPWASGDAVVIDSTTKSVTVNGSAYDFTGAFPEFPPGPGNIGYTDSLTTRTFNYNIAYYAMYM